MADAHCHFRVNSNLLWQFDEVARLKGATRSELLRRFMTREVRANTANLDSEGHRGDPEPPR